MRNLAQYERRAREAEELAKLVAQPENRERYLALARAWREMIAEPKDPPHPASRAA